MKKYTLFLLILAFALGLFGLFNINRASAVNCAPGDLFNSTTGKRCSTNTTTVECATGDLFSSATGQRCTAWRDDSSIDVNQRFSFGMRGSSVLALQQALLKAGFYYGKLDGIYGRISDQAFLNYKNRYTNPVTPTPCPAGTVATGMTNSLPPRYICEPKPISTNDSFYVNPSTTKIMVKETTTLQALYSSCPSGAQCLVGPLAVQATWSSNNTNVATVAYKNVCPPDQYCIAIAPNYLVAVVTGVSAGTATITATYTDTSGKVFRASALVTVSGTVNPPCCKITPPIISSLSPTSGAIDAQVTIYGSGFTATGNRIKFGDLGMENNPRAVYNSDGNKISFNVPSGNYYACWDSNPACYIMATMTPPGVYAVSVINANGTSNKVNFTVTGSAASTAKDN